MHYELKLKDTATGIGFFAPEPARPLEFPEAVRFLVEHPMDAFIRNFLLEGVKGLEVEELSAIITQNLHAPLPFLSMLREACMISEKFAPLGELFREFAPEDLAAASPLVLQRSALLEDQQEHRKWTRLFEANRERHEQLPNLSETGLEPLYDASVVEKIRNRETVPVDAVLEEADARAESVGSRPQVRDTFERAISGLTDLGVPATEEMRHESSLSPVALLRRWHLDVNVDCGRNAYRMTGIQTSWGKGMNLDVARASYAMEMVERVASFLSVGQEGVKHLKRAEPLLHASFSELFAAGRRALDPNSVRLDVPYRDQKLHWMSAQTWDEDSILVPVQFVGLFSNLDEQSFFGGLGSTGLASGNTMAGARVSGLLECLERDAEGLALFDPSRCFTIEAENKVLARHLEALRERGVAVVFQDMTGETGVPCYRAFVTGEDGSVAKGTAAHLDGRKAVLSALTEVPYPFPESPPSAPAPEGLPARLFEELPNFSADDAGINLSRLESVLVGNGYSPIYVDLTRADVDIPVCRAIVPGLELTADFDSFSRVSPRLYAAYLDLSGTGEEEPSELPGAEDTPYRIF